MWHFLYLSAGSRVGPTRPKHTVTTPRSLVPVLDAREKTSTPVSQAIILRKQRCQEGRGRGIKWHNRKARRPFPVSFLAIKSQTPVEVLTPSKYTFPRPWPATAVRLRAVLLPLWSAWAQCLPWSSLAGGVLVFS